MSRTESREQEASSAHDHEHRGRHDARGLMVSNAIDGAPDAIHVGIGPAVDVQPIAACVVVPSFRPDEGAPPA